MPVPFADLSLPLQGMRYDKADHVATITLDRPDRGNSLIPVMQEQFRSIWRDVQDDDDVRCVIVTAAGERHFCTGADVTEVADAGKVAGGDGRITHEVVWSPRQNDVWKPVIAAVNGVANGAGLHFVVDADIVVAAENASFMDTHVNVGMVGAIENIGLAKRLPLGTALRMTLQGRNFRLSAERAYQLGLVDELVPAAELLTTAPLHRPRHLRELAARDDALAAGGLECDRDALLASGRIRLGSAATALETPRFRRGAARVRREAAAGVGHLVTAAESGGSGGVDTLSAGSPAAVAAAAASTREQLRDLVVSYAACADRGLLTEVVDLFTDDGLLVVLERGRAEHRYAGRAEIMGLLNGATDGWSSTERPVAVRHHLTNIRVELESPERATGHTYFLATVGDRLDHWGRYRDEYRLTPAGWRFAARTVRTDGRAGLDLDAVRNLKASFHRALDDKDWAAVGELITDDCEFGFGPDPSQRVTGAAAFVAAVSQALATGSTVHRATQPQLRVLDEHTVHGRWAQHDIMVAPDGTATQTFGDSEEQYVLGADGRWRIGVSQYVNRVTLAPTDAKA